MKAGCSLCRKNTIYCYVEASQNKDNTNIAKNDDLPANQDETLSYLERVLYIIQSHNGRIFYGMLMNQ